MCKVYVSGPVKWGDDFIRVASEGTLIEEGKRTAFVNIDIVGNDRNVSVYVNKSYVKKIENHINRYYTQKNREGAC